jgi:hypothetical protein
VCDPDAAQPDMIAGRKSMRIDSKSGTVFAHRAPYRP